LSTLQELCSASSIYIIVSTAYLRYAVNHHIVNILINYNKYNITYRHNGGMSCKYHCNTVPVFINVAIILLRCCFRFCRSSESALPVSSRLAMNFNSYSYSSLNIEKNKIDSYSKDTNTSILTILMDQALSVANVSNGVTILMDQALSVANVSNGGNVSYGLAVIEWNALHDLYSMTNGQKWLWRKKNGEIWNFTDEGNNHIIISMYGFVYSACCYC